MIKVNDRVVSDGALAGGQMSTHYDWEYNQLVDWDGRQGIHDVLVWEEDSDHGLAVDGDWTLILRRVDGAWWTVVRCTKRSLIQAMWGE
jgi:hypothetical protein